MQGSGNQKKRRRRGARKWVYLNSGEHRPGPCGKLSVRQHLSGAPRQLPSRGAFPLRQRVSKPPLEGRWHGEAVTERCAAAQRRRRVSALCTGRNPAGNLRCGNTSQALRASSPQGEPSLSDNGSLSLPLRGGPQGSAASGGRSDRSGWAATCLGGLRSCPGRLSGNPGARRSRDGEVCRRAAAAARQRPLHRPGPCGKPLVR